MVAEVFVFGSNLEGVHGAGAALYAAQKYGAKRGVGEGHVGMSYALPTRKVSYRGGMIHSIDTLPLPAIQTHVDTFIQYASQHPEFRFRVTCIGTGHAGLEHDDMAPMFVAASGNCFFDSAWGLWLPGKTFWGTY